MAHRRKFGVCPDDLDAISVFCYARRALDCHNRERSCKISSKSVLFPLTAWTTLSIFTSMFVERMKVLEYRQKFEVEISTFPDSTNTETPRKLVFSLTCVCLSVCQSVCLSVCAKKFVSGYLTKELTDLDENYGVCCNWRRIENLP